MRMVNYTYPDGTKSSRKPKDGEIYRVWNQIDQDERVWQWDGFKERWYDITLESAFERILKETQEEAKCECGSEKVGSNKHSTWCRKWSASS